MGSGRGRGNAENAESAENAREVRGKKKRAGWIDSSWEKSSGHRAVPGGETEGMARDDLGVASNTRPRLAAQSVLPWAVPNPNPELHIQAGSLCYSEPRTFYP